MHQAHVYNPSHYSSYSEAIHHAADTLLSCTDCDRCEKARSLMLLLGSTATSIPTAWCSKSCEVLSRIAQLNSSTPSPRDLDEVIGALNDDLIQSTAAHELRYNVLSSILQLALTVRGLIATPRGQVAS
jgi:hypothetical protein